MARLTGETTKWCPLPDDPDGASILVKHLKTGEERDIQDTIELYETSLKPDAEGNLQREIKINPAKGDKRYAYLCAAVREWKGFFDADGQEMPCTDENKIRMARDDESFGPFVGQCRTELAEDVAKEREAARKNSVS